MHQQQTVFRINVKLIDRQYLMFDYSENGCYLSVCRPPTKSFMHLLTGNCQIQRVTLNNDHERLQYSIRHSKMLDQYKKKYPCSVPYRREQAEQLFRIKNIIENTGKFYTGKILRQLHCYQYTIHTTEVLKKLKYDTKNQQHQYKLLEIWENLKPHEKLTGRISEQWISLGFQVSDPATDFRGAGYLGLYNLYQYSKSKHCKKTFQIASNPKTQYFFCSAGLYFTMLTSQILKRKVIQYSFWVNQSQQQLLNNFQLLYETIFQQFSLYWLKECSNKSIMHFNQNLKNFQIRVKKWDALDYKDKIVQHIN